LKLAKKTSDLALKLFQTRNWLSPRKIFGNLINKKSRKKFFFR
jgi:hypothetical protein